jgi:AAA+ ATPase superfamily predicted ATPase
MTPHSPPTWNFYGRSPELDKLTAILSRKRWFFVKITGRRRIGKTALVQEALARAGHSRALYIQIPDSDPAGVLATARDFYDLFQVPGPRPTDLKSLAQDLARLMREGWIVALDEFQYFHRKALFEFTSHLQLEVDRLTAQASQVSGGLLVLGSIHTEMAALLEERSAPLFNRITDELEVTHLDIASVLEILEAHAEPTPERLLFLWNLFEGVPKFYRDCFEQDVLAAPRAELLERMFFSSSSPLRNEADNWFLRELRGRYDLVLKYVATHPGCTNGDIDAHTRSVDPASEKQVGGYIKILRDKFRMIDRLQPIFAKPTARNGRFYITDNFLRSWLAALQTATAAVHFRPLPQLVAEADARLAEAEGHGLERLVAALYEERSRKALGDFSLTHRIEGYWDKADKGASQVEIDLVAIDEASRTIRLGTCKRQPDKLLPDLRRFNRHVQGFLTAMPRYAGWTVERVAMAPVLSGAQRSALHEAGYLAQDLHDLTAGLRPVGSLAVK